MNDTAVPQGALDFGARDIGVVVVSYASAATIERCLAALLAVSPQATVPVLVTETAGVLTQSLDIMHWALAQAGDAGWLQRGDGALARQLVSTTDSDFKHWLDRYKYPERHPECGQTDYREEAARCLIEPLEAALLASGHLGGDGRPHAGAVRAEAHFLAFHQQRAGRGGRVTFQPHRGRHRHAGPCQAVQPDRLLAWQHDLQRVDFAGRIAHSPASVG